MSKITNKTIIYSVVRDDYWWDECGNKALRSSSVTAHSKTWEKAVQLAEEYKQKLHDNGFPDDVFIWRVIGNTYYDE